MSLEALTAGMFALRGLSLLSQMVREARGDSRVQDLAERIENGEALNEAEFDELLDRLLALAEESAGETAPEVSGEDGLAALIEQQRSLSPLLFAMLDRDGNGQIEGTELSDLRRLVDHLREGLPAEASARAAQELHMATT